MSDRPKASAPKTSSPKAPSAKSGAATTSWLAGFITRAAAGIVYAVVFILCLVLGIVPTAIFVSVMSGLCCYEFFRMTKLDGKVANERLGIAAAVLFPLSALGDSLLLNALLFALMLAVGIWYVWSSRTRISDVAVTLMGPIYTGFMLSAIVLLREFAVSGMRLVAVEQGRVIAAAWSGKVKTASTMVCLCAMLLNVFGAYAWFDPLCNAVIVLTTAYSGIEYFIKNADVFREPD